MTEIEELVKSGNNQLLKERLSENPSIVFVRTEQGISLLQLAAYYKNHDAVQMIRKHYQKLDIFEAVSVGDNKTVLDIVKTNPDQINAHSKDGFTPLGLASFFGQLELVKVLLNNGADPNIASQNQLMVTPLHSACATSNFEIAQILIRNNAEVNAKQMQGVTPLHSAVHNGHLKLVKLLLENGANTGSKMDDGQTPVSMAKEKGIKEIIELLRNGEK